MKEIAKALIERLEEWGFTSHRRECHQASHYGTVENGVFVPDDEIVLEDWSNEDMVNCILGEHEMSDSADKLKKLLKSNK